MRSDPRGSGRNFVRAISYLLTAPAHVCAHTGDTVAVNPEISSGLPLADFHRRPPPASRPERYATPASKGAYILCLMRIAD